MDKQSQIIHSAIVEKQQQQICRTVWWLKVATLDDKISSNNLLDLIGLRKLEQK
jgi:hypothetical protein